MRMTKPAAAKSGQKRTTPPAETRPKIDLDHYAPAYLTWIANKLSGGASNAYLRAFDVGIETWRILVLLAIERSLAAQSISRTIGMDKSSVSRVFKSMQARGLIAIELDPADGRFRVATITEKGRALHDKILELAKERERAFLSVLTEDESRTLLDLLHRLHDNLPRVEEVTSAFLDERYPKAKGRRPRGSSKSSSGD